MPIDTQKEKLTYVILGRQPTAVVYKAAEQNDKFLRTKSFYLPNGSTGN